MIPWLALLATLGDTPSTAPHGLGVEDTYTITAVMKLLPPADPAAMTDAYQDAKLLRRERDAFVMSITYFPMEDEVRQRRRARYAAEVPPPGRYLASTTTCNWDLAMRRRILADLTRAGIPRPPRIDREYVQKVASWALARSRFDGNPEAMPADWFVSFDRHRPVIAPELRKSFEEVKGAAPTPDAEVFARQLFGRSMFERQVHGQCTSTSIYLATILRAIGIPTRIVAFVPAADGNDPRQTDMLRRGIRHHQIRTKVVQGVASTSGFTNHMFNEVWIGGQWVRLNYDRLDQPIVDTYYLGLMTHIASWGDYEESRLAETWGARIARWPKVASPLTSINPYQLLAIGDHWGARASRANPPTQILDHGTVVAAPWKGSPEFSRLVPDAMAPGVDVMLITREWIESQNYMQMRDFMRGASHRFRLVSAGHPDVSLEYTGLNVSNSETRGYGFRLAPADAGKLVRGATYRLLPENEGKPFPWQVTSDVTVRPFQ